MFDKAHKESIIKLSLFSFLLSSLYFITSGCATQYNPATGKEELVLISSEAEVKKGRSLSKRVQKKFEAEQDWRAQDRVERVGARIAAVCDRKDISYEFEVLSGQEMNAFALPGGYVYVFKGLFDRLDSDDELAGVLAHEIGHIVARHSITRTQSSIGYTALRILLSRMEGDPLSRQKAYQGINELMMSYSREDEIEADILAVRYVKLAGYNPEGILSVLEKLKRIELEKPIGPKRQWRSHPYIHDRIRATKEEIFGKIDFEDYINIVE